MLKRSLLILFVALTPLLHLDAQNTDQVTLQNGTVIRGNIVKIVPGGNITIDDRAGNTWVFDMTEVRDMEEVEETAMVRNGFNPGWINMTSIGFLAGSQRSDYIAPFSLQTSVGYRMESGIYTGMLVGLEFLNINHLPVMFDFQYSLRNSDVMPVLIARGGYAVPTKTSSEYYGSNFTYSGGLSTAAGVGLKIRTRASFAWDVSLLYRHMRISYTEEYDYNPVDYTNLDVYNRLEIRLGFYLDLQN